MDVELLDSEIESKTTVAKVKHCCDAFDGIPDDVSVVI